MIRVFLSNFNDKDATFPQSKENLTATLNKRKSAPVACFRLFL
ncbi:hypothetical protein HMPREF3213_03653 [Heyndrickxia coagulans]|uniref:Uncharacterized protein n=1 Tax=Heyndrickxia coagulans TaxID=1398 RepID=A0A133KBC7_HEYCO|nr:hypothetical protein HMPREF3213_03653 [Heyndrickxia coagulans]